MNELLLRAFCRFSKAHIESGDIDPTYPLLKRVYELEKLDKETALWRTILYLTFYHLGSAHQASRMFIAPSAWARGDFVPLPTGTERRGFRGNQLAWEHLAIFLKQARADGGTLAGFFDLTTASGGKLGWKHLRDAVQDIPYIGSWASYKLADLLKQVHDYPITADSIGAGGGSATAGPVPGMVRVTGEDWERCATDFVLQQELLDECVRLGVPFNGLDQLETALCDFNSLCKGAYYVGHDIDTQMEHLKALPPLYWEARGVCFPSRYLGEVGGWFGVRKQLKAVYRDRGELLL